jgi:hypothetical protein
MAEMELGRLVPLDFHHIEKYPMLYSTTPTIPAPVTIGVNWYRNFDTPIRDNRGRYWVGRSALGSIRGGHCVCIPPQSLLDAYIWYDYYDQGKEGACVGFGASRMMSLLNRRRYNARWLWEQAKAVDEFPETNPGDNNGTTVRAAMDVLRQVGHVRVLHNKDKPAVIEEGIKANRWAKTVEEVLSILQSPLYESRGAVPFLNSWGRSYPHKTWMPLEVLQRLLDEYGEASMVTDR